MIGLGKTKLFEKGMTLLEALVSTAIIGIGFVAVFQMVNYSVQSIDVSGERTKANYLVSMVSEMFVMMMTMIMMVLFFTMITVP